MVLALLGWKALLLFVVWLAAAWTGGYLSERKGYGDKPGLASGLLLTAVGPLLWLLVPARAGSDWKLKGPFGNALRDDGAGEP
ncbi:MAG TPA: hypothetical protein VHB30_12360 [Solirubrobacteraceae bacterium]|jgi:hypothetical protein|nr:hypothetical protein [Solirubrobacteraceae bacterium]